MNATIISQAYRYGFLLLQICHTPEASKLPGFLKSNKIIEKDE
jgi:hypothetical protein